MQGAAQQLAELLGVAGPVREPADAGVGTVQVHPLHLHPVRPEVGERHPDHLGEAGQDGQRDAVQREAVELGSVEPGTVGDLGDG